MEEQEQEVQGVTVTDAIIKAMDEAEECDQVFIIQRKPVDAEHASYEWINSDMTWADATFLVRAAQRKLEDIALGKVGE